MLLGFLHGAFSAAGSEGNEGCNVYDKVDFLHV